MKRSFLFFMLGLILLSACVSKPTGETQVPTQSGIPSKPLPSTDQPTVTPPPGPVVWEHATASYELKADDGTILAADVYDLPCIQNPTGYPPWDLINLYYENILHQLDEGFDQGAQQIQDEYNIAKASGFVFSTYEYKITYEVLYQSERAVSLRLNTLSAVEEERHAWFFGHQFNLQTGSQLYFADLFSCQTENAQTRVLAAVQTLAAADGYDAAVVERYFNPQQFLLTDEGILFYFWSGTIDHDPDTQPSFLVPYGTLEDILVIW